MHGVHTREVKPIPLLNPPSSPHLPRVGPPDIIRGWHRTLAYSYSQPLRWWLGEFRMRRTFDGLEGHLCLREAFANARDRDRQAMLADGIRIGGAA